MQPEQPQSGLCELASLYALGACSAEETSAFEQHLSSCPRCRQELGETADALQVLTSGLSVPPSPGLRSKVLQAVAGDAAPRLELNGLLVARPREMEWQPTPIPGISVKVLFTNEQRKYSTSLVKLAPGAQYPSHRHADVEELFMLAGDLQYDSFQVNAGDYCRAEPHSVHSSSYTRNGCLVLVVSSQRDEILA